MIELNAYTNLMQRQGWAIIPDLVDRPFVAELNRDLEKAYTTCREVQRKNGIDVNTDGTVHHLLGQADSFLDLFARVRIHPYVDRFFEGAKFIVNTYGGVINLPAKPSYVCTVHRDVRTFTTVPTMLNLLVMLDDFTPENGATHLLTGGHKIAEKPSDEYFFAKSDRAVGEAGSLLFFNSNLWHAGGENRTTVNRRALTIAFTRPHLKQQLDYPRALGYERCAALPEEMQQIVGYYARVPSNLDEWYQPPEKRFYRPGQG